MSNTKRGTSDVPLVMGIIGTVLNIPATLCAATCGAIVSGVSKMAGSESGSDLGNLIIFIAVVSGFSGLVGGILAKSSPNTGGTFLLIAALLSGIEVITIANFISFIVFILFLIGSIYAFTKTTDTTDFLPNNTQNITQNISIGHVDEANDTQHSSLQNKRHVDTQTQNYYPSEGKIKNPYK